MSGSLIDLTAKKDLGWLATVVQDLQVATDREQALLVGAQARALLLHYITACRPRMQRPTWIWLLFRGILILTEHYARMN